ncbi:conserved hypothetical protein [Gluconacetobacter diazotrophicus PA1 5]|uniref:Uncharacterized protein n=2 Tax=Gluconacetobacter diazotrophicus TaxID=33996 RepID=A0A7W4I5R5_GLUDI|nr:hypothetical protein [Gluconacetobacter diazotrophicus]ACI52500.1 conserved hypothetical protein [Gluconacetobacter diazotrophicus PA1 5]MBB2156772.1 hypothetical protein [Gluconacetobacter diazotrophicus]TWB03111.1 hypothetical protein FBZ86_12222 [Gluconacetobacter diazotrophicus]
MDRAIALVTGIALGLFGLIVTAIATIEHMARQILASMGIVGELQTALLVILLVGMIVAAFRVFGGAFSVLISLVLILILLHALLATAGVPLH